MTTIENVNAVFVNGVVSLSGIRGGDRGDIRLGATLSDGEREFEITGLPFVRYRSLEDMRSRVCVTVRGDADAIAGINGRTFWVVKRGAL